MNGSWQWTSRGTGGKQRSGFTLIELLVVIAVIGLLISLVLPSLGSARRTAWTVLCQNSLRQIGVGLRMYMDDQKDPVFPKLYDDNVAAFYPVRMVDTLDPYLAYAGSAAFNCAAAKGMSSVRDPQNILYHQGAAGGAPRVYTLPFPGFIGNPPVTQYTEYWFNDSRAYNGTSTEYLTPWGVSNQKTRFNKWPQFIVWSTDALDEFPRHRGGKANPRRFNGDESAGTRVGKNNFLFADQSIKLIDYLSYYEGRDPVNSEPQFWNWGHFYRKGSF